MQFEGDVGIFARKLIILESEVEGFKTCNIDITIVLYQSDVEMNTNEKGPWRRTSILIPT